MLCLVAKSRSAIASYLSLSRASPVKRGQMYTNSGVAFPQAIERFRRLGEASMKRTWRELSVHLGVNTLASFDHAQDKSLSTSTTMELRCLYLWEDLRTDFSRDSLA
jgi:hypothetical protein